jgi:hypothetical protein
MMLWQMWETAHAIPHKDDDTKPVPNPLLLNDSPCSAPPDWMLLDQEYLDKTTKLFAQAETLAKDPETLRRVHIAKLPLLYVKLGRALGYITEFGEYVSGSWIKTRDAAQKAAYQALLQEFLKITEEGDVKYISAFTTTRAITDKWQGILGLSDAPLSVFRLSNQWQFKTDPEKAGVAQNWAAAQTNDAGWADVSSNQHDKGWESQGFADYKGTAWYRQRFTLPTNFERHKHVYLYFGAVDSESEIYLNGVKVFDHTMASTGLTVNEIWNAPFAFDAAPYLKAGENVLAVRVSSAGGVRGIWKPALILSSDDALSADSLKLMIPN